MASLTILLSAGPQTTHTGDDSVCVLGKYSNSKKCTCRALLWMEAIPSFSMVTEDLTYLSCLTLLSQESFSCNIWEELWPFQISEEGGK